MGASCNRYGHIDEKKTPSSTGIVDAKVMQESASPRQSAAPRYLEVASNLLARIAAGEYPVGSLLPKEVELSRAYGISRHTMREALRRLSDAGVVSRRRRAGTEVIAAQPSTNYRQPTSSIDDLLQYGDQTEVRLTSRQTTKCSGEIASLLGGDPDREWLRVETLRTQPGEDRPICHTTMYLNLELEGIQDEIAGLSVPVSALVEKTYGIRIAEIEQSIEAVALDPPSARSLHAEPGAPALKATRRYYDADGRLIELAIALHPGERFTYVTRLKRN
jgi:DNA-binding GntR family transcriptional regulator